MGSKCKFSKQKYSNPKPRSERPEKKEEVLELQSEADLLIEFTTVDDGDVPMFPPVVSVNTGGTEKKNVRDSELFQGSASPHFFLLFLAL